MTSRIDPITPAEADDEEIEDILQAAAEGWWEDPAMMGVMAHQPQLLKSIIPAFRSFFIEGDVETHIYELMRLKDGEINRCTYCSSVRTKAVEDEVTEKEDALFGEVDEDAFTRREYLAIRLAEQMAGDPNYIQDEFFEELRTVYTDEEIVELVFGCGLLIFGNKFNITMTLDVDEESPYPSGLEYPLGDPSEVTTQSD